MSNNLVSQQLPITSMQMGQLEPIVNKVDSSGRDLQMGLLHSISSDPVSQQQTTLDDHAVVMRAMLGNPASQGLSISNIQSGRVESHVNNMGMHKLFIPNKQSIEMETMLNSVGPQQLSTTPKRKAPMEPFPSSSVTSNKRVAQFEHRPWLQQVSNASNKGSLPMQPLSNAPRPQHLAASNKRKTQMESTSSKSGMPRSVLSKIQNAQVQQSSKAQTESSESVRSKMRESLAAALALVSKPDKPKFVNNNASNEAENCSQCAGSASAATDTAQGQNQDIAQSVDSNSAATDSVEHGTGGHAKTSASNEDFSEKCKDSEVGSTNMSTNENTLDSVQVSNFDKQDFQSSFTFSTDDVPFSDNFFVKDELLQGNGLSWVLDSDMVEMTSRKESQINEEQRYEPEEIGGGCKEQAVCSPELLASRIEAELFKLFGGVNKKYKEKGRSLLFNLKDRNNPELRERVMSGEIPPERLCSMTAEELASKELSQWRIAKAEELAQMVVLPSDGDIRRLVKKTHKGEFQVEVEHEDNVSVEVSGGATMVLRSQTKRKDVEAPSSSTPDGIKGDVKTDGEKSNLETDNSIALTIPSNDGTDPMQGLMADDALRDADFLPPIVSLDEFMESLHSEPPFENLAVESGKVTPISVKGDSEVGSALKPSDLTPSDHVNRTHDKSQKIHNSCPNVDADLDKRANPESGVIPSDTRCNESPADRKPSNGSTEVRSTDGIQSPSSHAELKSSQCHAEEKYGGSLVPLKTAVPTSIFKGECIWDGMVQLNVSTTHSVISIFKSGEKTSVKDWPGFLEIKGRVRLDAFEKFLQELPMSRTRAIMVSHFVSKESPNNEEPMLREVADSYISDERVGFAEPVPRVELYFCPPHKKTVEMLSKILPKEQIEAVNAIDYGLIGITVWRKNQLTSSISPTSSSHHKHSSKKQYFSWRQQDTNMDSNLTSKTGPPTGSTTTETGSPTDDDIPPGFGPAMTRDEDDLPEFSFSGSANPSRMVQKPYMGPSMAPFHSVNQTTSRPVEQMRELVHKYGQNKENASSGNWQDKFGVAFQPWNDEDDDIPEWHPQSHQNQFPSHQPMHDFQLRPHLLNQSYAASHHQSLMQQIQSLQPPLNGTQGQRNVGPIWVPPTQGNNLQPSGGQLYGAPALGASWRQNVPRSKGF